MGAELENKQADFDLIGDVGFSDSEIIRHVQKALLSVSSVPQGNAGSYDPLALGYTDDYDQLVGTIHSTRRLDPDGEALLVTSLKALSGAVSYIKLAHHERLLSAIFGINMWNHGLDVLDALVELIISLAASCGDYVDLCLDMLVSNFMPPQSFLSILNQPRGIARKEQVLYKVHSALKDISDLVPLAPKRLLSIIVSKMPNVFRKDPIVMYAENMLRLEGSVIGELVGIEMLDAVVIRLVDLDVEIGWDDSSKGIFEMELEELDESDEDGNDVNEVSKESCRRYLGGSLFADKLDGLIVLMFEHLKSCHNDGRLTEVFETLLHSFQLRVLLAYKSKFAQFVMFYACSLDPEHCGVRFAMMLADIFVCSIYPPIKRMSAVAYLASYLARGKFLPASFVASMLKRLVDWCAEYCQSHNDSMNPKAHGVFYSGCQAFMYILCFRMRSIMDFAHLKSELLLMPIEPILKHPLNPLEVCLPSIVEEFLQQAKAARLYTVSETFVFNDLLESELSRAFGGMQRLDMFFPFDPCLLKQSDRYIRPNYVYWSTVRTTYADDECSSDGDEDDMGGRESIADDEMGCSFEEHNIDAYNLNSSMCGMSITPKETNYNLMASGVGALRKMPCKIRPSTSPESL